MDNIASSEILTWNCKKGCKEQVKAPVGDCEVCGGFMFRSDGKTMNMLIGEHEAECRRIWHGIDVGE